MSESSSNPGKAAWEIIGVIARWLLAALFLYMGLKKAMEPVAFLKLVRQYGVVHSAFSLNFIASTLPWFETICGLLLLTGVAVRGTALVLAAELIPFTFLVVRRAMELQSLKSIPFCAVKFDCGCGAGEVFICHKLMENSALVLICVGLLFGWGRRFCLRYSLFQRRADAPVPPPH